AARVVASAPGATNSTMPITTRYAATRKNRAAITVTLAGRSIAMRLPQIHRKRQAGLWHTISMPSLTLGDFELSIFSDGTYPLDGGAFFGVIPKVMWSRKMASDEKNYVQAGLNSLLIRTDHPRTGKQNVLVETG